MIKKTVHFLQDKKIKNENRILKNISLISKRKIEIKKKRTEKVKFKKNNRRSNL